MQVGEVDKALNIKDRRSPAPMLKCKKCCFEGPLHPRAPSITSTGRAFYKKIPDGRVYHLYGVSFTWQFLFKSHVGLKQKPKGRNAGSDMEDSLFACIFCCAGGRGTPVYKGPEALAWHLRAHCNDGDKLDAELKIRYACIIGRDPEQGEAYDVLVPNMGVAFQANDASTIIERNASITDVINSY